MASEAQRIVQEYENKLQRLKLEAEFAHDCEKWLINSRKHLISAFTELSNAPDTETQYSILLNVMRSLVEFDQVVLLSLNVESNNLVTIYASHPALAQNNWENRGVLKLALDNSDIMVLSDPGIAAGFESTNPEFKQLIRSVMLIPMSLHDSKLLFVCTHQRQLALNLESRRDVRLLKPFLEQLVTNIEYKGQLEEVIKRRTSEALDEQEYLRAFTHLSHELNWKTDENGCFVPIPGDNHEESHSSVKNSLPDYTKFIGRKFEELLDPDELKLRPDLPEVIKERRQKRLLCENVELPLQIEGRKYWLRVTAEPYYDRKSQQFVGFRGTLSDFTSEYTQNQELQKARDAAEIANRSKSEYLAVMSHEIKTPLQAILGMLDLLEQTSLDETQLTYIKHISQSASLLQTILHDVLDLSRIESQAMVLENINFDIQFTLRSVSLQMQEKAESKGIYLKLNIKDGFPQMISGDQHRLSQILFNLINNALKFTSKGGVTVVAERFDTRLKFSVIDTGPGIPSEHLSELFVPFVQLDGSISRKFGGSGLGLAICKRLVEHMGGRIGIKSEVGKGSDFWFEIPCRIPSSSLIGATSIKRTIEHKEHNYNILLVEDSQINQFVIKTMLEKLGHNVRLASNGAEAVEAVKAEIPDLVLMDLRMPVMDGIEATRHIINELTYVPIVALTANSTDEERIACREAGMVSIASKPVTSVILKKLLLELEEVIDDSTERLEKNGLAVGKPCPLHSSTTQEIPQKFMEESAISSMASFEGKQNNNMSLIDALMKNRLGGNKKDGSDHQRTMNNE